ncbi:hypothetical protein COU57_06370 [Candidatus Pacearchaeota archaeon CG10_big_fil_rev_8_21_14_0_10_32_14]|nr:MAG: hypothetical protein COU57_06370 [Candidatus Pacearchaeota archaeon CG10_big_fil_rev_8_21_14_0_10_32_14]
MNIYGYMEIKLIKPNTCSPDETIFKVSAEFQKKKLRRMLVVDKQNKLVGILTTVDLVKFITSGKDSRKTKVKEFMISKVKSVEEDEKLEDALKIMNQLKTFVCPVTRKGKLIGVVGYQDIIAHAVSKSRS